MPDNSESHNESSLSVKKGVNPGNSINQRIRRSHNQRHSQTVEEFVNGIREGNRTILSQAITLIESARAEHQEKAQEIIEKCLPDTGNSIRLGITGVPGVGKSTFIEALGNHLIEKGRKLAVLAVDPSSSRSKGSILGDKTRMETLANSAQAFIRPSSTGGSLGGVARKTRESIYLCEAAGFDTIFIETVGVGQSETAVHSMIDFFLLLMLAGAGDELQGIKRGIMEMADLIAINKVDEANLKSVKQAVREYKSALHLYREEESGWRPKVTTCSALTGKGIDKVWKFVQSYINTTKKNDYFAQNRHHQAKHWMYEAINHQLKKAFYSDSIVQEELGTIEKQVSAGKISPFKAAQQLLEHYQQ